MRYRAYVKDILRALKDHYILSQKFYNEKLIHKMFLLTTISIRVIDNHSYEKKGRNVFI